MNGKRLTRRDALRAGALATTAGIAGCTVPGAERTLLAEGFETGVDPWTTHAAIPDVPLSEFDWEVDRSREQAAAGEWSLRVFTEGSYDDGTAWAARQIRVPNPAEVDRFRVTARAWSESESFNLLRYLVMALAPSPPESESDFPDPGANSTGISGASYGGLREPLHRAEGWEEYAFEWTPETIPRHPTLAVGVSVVWEADATHYVDEIRVESV